MADPTVKLVFTGNSADAERAIASLERKYATLEEKLKRVGAQSRMTARQSQDAFSSTKGIDSWGKSIGDVVMKLGGMATMAATIKTALMGAGNEIKTINSEMEKFRANQADAELKLQIQGGFTPEQVKEQIPNLKDALFATPSATPTEAVQLQAQLAGAGFNAEDVKSGAAAKAMLDLKAVTNAFGEDAGDPKEAVLGMSQLIKGLGNVNPRAKDLQRIGAKVATLMTESDVQFADLAQLAGDAATLKQFGMSESEQLGAFSWMRDIKGAEEGATGLRIFTSRTATAATDKNRTEALKSIGLKPEDVAIAQGGVTFKEAITKIQGGMAGLSEEDKNKFLVEMYGEKGQASAAVMLDPKQSEKIFGRIQMADQASGEFQKRLETFQGSPEAVMKRFSHKGEWAARDEAMRGMTWGQMDEFMKSRNMQLMAGQETPEARRTVGVGAFAGWAGRGMTEIAGFRPTDVGAPTRDEMVEIGKQQLAEIKRLADEVERNNRRPPPPNQKGQREGGL